MKNKIVQIDTKKELPLFVTNNERKRANPVILEKQVAQNVEKMRK